MFSQGLRGFVGQSMAGRRTLDPYIIQLPPGTTSWSPPSSGTYKAILKGAGGAGRVKTAAGGSGATGGSGAHCEVTFLATYGLPVVVTVGAGDSETDTTLVALGKGTVTAGAGKNAATGGAAGTASNGDYMLNGSAGVSSGAGTAGLGVAGGAGGLWSSTANDAGGAGAPGTAEFPGGRGGNNTTAAFTERWFSGQFPGGGGGTDPAFTSGTTVLPSGADGVIFIVRVR